MFLAHALGERYDLPIPLLLFVIGGAPVVIASFVLVLGRDVGAASPDAHRYLGAERPTIGSPGRASTPGWSRWSATRWSAWYSSPSR